MDTKISTHLPIIVICGLTGTGKSKLAIDLATLFSGEVINSDAVQLYKGLPIATNKVTESECGSVPHHLLGCFSPSSKLIDVHQFRSLCIPLVDEIRSLNRHIPILVGGTHYYIEAILWSDFLSADYYDTQHVDCISQQIHLPLTTHECLDQLQSLNPELAANFHPNNSRKIRAALRQHLIQKSCSIDNSIERKASSIHGPSNRSYSPRWPDQTIIFWLDCDKNVLNCSLDKRVDKMVESGLLEELDNFLHLCTDSLSSVDRQNQVSELFNESKDMVQSPLTRRGILQSIGFKEFADYLALPPDSLERNGPAGEKMLKYAIDAVKLATRQYARRQVKWIVNRFLKRPVIGGIPVYRLDVTECIRTVPFCENLWRRQILGPASRIIYNHISKSYNSLEVGADLSSLLDFCPSGPAAEPFDDTPDGDNSPLPSPLVCSICNNRIFAIKRDYKAHCSSRSHKKRVNKLNHHVMIEKHAVPGSSV